MTTTPNTPASADALPFEQYRRKQIAELRPYVAGDDMEGISVSQEDAKAGSPKAGDMIARNPKNHADQWLVAAAYFADNFEPIRTAANASEGSAPIGQREHETIDALGVAHSASVMFSDKYANCASNLQRETAGIDEILSAFDIGVEQSRSEGGALRVAHIVSLLRERTAAPHAVEPTEAVTERRPLSAEDAAVEAAYSEERGVKRALDALDEMAEEWAERAGIVEMSVKIAAMIDRPGRIAGLVKLAWTEGAYTGRRSHVWDALHGMSDPMPDGAVSDSQVDAAMDAWLATNDRESMYETTRAMLEAAERARQRPKDDVSAPRGADCEALDVEEMLKACVPGGDFCDPQSVCDSIREWFAERRVRNATTRDADQPRDFDPGTVIATLTLDDGRTASDRVTASWAAQVLRELGGARS